MPDEELFDKTKAGCVQRFDESDGTIHLPTDCNEPDGCSKITVLRCDSTVKLSNTAITAR